MLKDFKESLMRGNVLDHAVAAIIGAALGKIVTSFVNDRVIPPIGLLLGNVDFSSLYLNLSGTPYASLADAQAAGARTMNYGIFINTIVDFAIVALAIFLVVRLAKNAQKPKAEDVQAPSTKKCPHCLATFALKATRYPSCTSGLWPVIELRCAQQPDGAAPASCGLGFSRGIL